MFYPDIHHGEHECDTYLGPCPGPKPEDYLMIRRGRPGDPAIVELVTHYINHGNTWQSAPKKFIDVRWGKVGEVGNWDYLILTESDLVDVNRNV